jgi:hypothetical protein
MDKKYIYRNGEPARILCIDRNDSNYPVVTESSDGYIRTHTATGRQRHDRLLESAHDLIEARPKVRVDFWVNVYEDGTVANATWEDRKDADRIAGSDRIACIHIEREVEEGEGLT